LVLQTKYIFKAALETVGPEVRSCTRIDKLPRDAHPVPRLAYAAFKHVAHSKLAADLLHINGAALVRKT
jgi:hypothetical protein